MTPEALVVAQKSTQMALDGTLGSEQNTQIALAGI